MYPQLRVIGHPYAGHSPALSLHWLTFIGWLCDAFQCAYPQKRCVLPPLASKVHRFTCVYPRFKMQKRITEVRFEWTLGALRPLSQ